LLPGTAVIGSEGFRNHPIRDACRSKTIEKFAGQHDFALPGSGNLESINWDEVRLIAFGMDKTVRIYIADDDHQVISALRLVIEQEPAWLVIHEFHTAVEMVCYFEDASHAAGTCFGQADSGASVLLIDWELPGFQPKKHIPEIRGLCPQIKIVGLSVMVAVGRDVLAYQVDAFVSKSDAPEHVISALRDLMLKLPPAN
jgi:CheY-like chemotaxis protein